MSEELQQIIDVLARRLGRAVAIDDVHFRLLAYTAHSDEVDAVRTRVILDRQAPAEAARWVGRFRLTRAVGAVRIPGDESIGIWPRVAIPVRHQSVHFGYLWLIDVDHSLTDAEVALAEQAADDSGEVLFRQRIVTELDRARQGELVRDLMSADPTVRDLAATKLVETGMFAPRGAVVALVLRPLPVPGQEITESDRLVLAAALEEAAHIAPPRECLTLVRPHHAVVIATEAALRRRESFPERLHAAAVDRFGDDPHLTGVIVGVGAMSRSLGDVVTSYEQAWHATRVAEVVPVYRPVARYPNLGVYALLLRMAADQLSEDALPESVRRLLHAEPDLLRTAEAFLDRAGDIRAVAGEFALHRATVYQRMRRISQVTGADLSDGEQRLALHLGIKLARLLRLC